MKFEDLITPAGIVAAGALVALLVQTIKTMFPAIDKRVSGALQSLVVVTVLYVLADIQIAPVDLNGHFQVFLSGVAVLSAAIGVHSGVSHAAEALPPAVNDMMKPPRRKRPTRRYLKRDEKFDGQK